MPKYLVTAAYTATGASGLLRDGGTGRKNAITSAVEGLGGRVECFYFALGENDVYTVIDLPDQTDAIALTLAVASSGGATAFTIPLVSPSDVDVAVKKTLEYRPPGA